MTPYPNYTALVLDWAHVGPIHNYDDPPRSEASTHGEQPKIIPKGRKIKLRGDNTQPKASNVKHSLRPP